jgi:type IV pilus assembly protein PilW
MKQSASRRSVTGVSLIEVLVSMVIGLVVVGAVIVSIVGSGKAGRFQSSYAQMNQDAQIGLSILSRELQMAGYSQPSGLVDTSGGVGTPTYSLSYNIGTATVVFGCDTGFANPQAASLACNASGSAPALEVVYEADLKNTVPTSGNVPSDCLGNGIPGVAPYFARNRFYIATATGSGASGRPELYCASNNAANSPQPILENIEVMRVWYGVQVLANPRQVVRYVSATDINAVGPTEWNNVISVRVCLLMRSAETVLESGGEDTLTYLDCDSTQQTSNDRYLRRAYFTTSTLRSKMPF